MLSQLGQGTPGDHRRHGDITLLRIAVEQGRKGRQQGSKQ